MLREESRTWFPTLRVVLPTISATSSSTSIRTLDTDTVETVECACAFLPKRLDSPPLPNDVTSHSNSIVRRGERLVSVDTDTLLEIVAPDPTNLSTLLGMVKSDTVLTAATEFIVAKNT
jgi:hypothetical protein